MRIALDAMGGDYAPEETVKGAVMAARELNEEIILVGDEPLIEETLNRLGFEKGKVKGISIYHAPESVGMGETPVEAIRKKRRSSIWEAMKLLKDEEIDAFVSAGNTGAVVAGALLGLGRIEGIDRPALGVAIPTLKGRTFLIDVGATVGCKPRNLYQFAIMGSVYMSTILGVENPRVGLLTVGEERGKGDEVIKETYEILESSSDINFIGNVEGKDIPFGIADVVVCDGFVGNVMLKFIEGVAEAVYKLLQEEIGKRLLPRIGILFMLPMLRDLWQEFDYEAYGGTPLLGVNGVIIVAHGRSKGRAIFNAIKVAREFVLQKGLEKIKKRLEGGG
ncbi:MAG: phosphate acyltransferase PlsX [Synergistetes bacterium]|nr:phosphate acyltransferase PlsX [Synergistota bacterium]MCX8127807.1 phosphate acyltransferase PlsX [Synergistota bacterium]MDW8192069.1 phosphate acyltransferase PlsX [Synergistota bacterium]